MLYAVFVSIFALDVFEGGYGFGQTMLALFVHLVPAAMIIVVLVISWRKEWLAAIVFFAAGILYLLSNLQHLDWVPPISGPLWLMGILFFVSWLQRKKPGTGP